MNEVVVVVVPLPPPVQLKISVIVGAVNGIDKNRCIDLRPLIEVLVDQVALRTVGVGVGVGAGAGAGTGEELDVDDRNKETVGEDNTEVSSMISLKLLPIADVNDDDPIKEPSSIVGKRFVSFVVFVALTPIEASISSSF